jgi:NadR type nicotinamide-nucleotide adenylyltransferase
LEKSIQNANRMIRIAITGPESSGKTTLCKALANHFKVAYVPEFAREFLNASNGKYTFTDLDKMATGQLNSIQNATNDITIVDSDFSVLEIWSNYKYGKVSNLILNVVQQNVFDLHILCSPDIPWEADPLRENPDNRNELFDLYLSSLNTYKKNYCIVSGSPEKRLKESLKNIVALQKK